MGESQEPLLTEEDIARTYSSDPDPVHTLTQFRQAHELRSSHPDWPRAKIAREVGRPPSAVRRWLVDNSKPRVVQAIEKANDMNWLPLYPDDRLFPAFNHLVAWIYSGGSISVDTFRPTFSIDHRLHRSVLANAFAMLDLDCNTVRQEESTDGLDISLEARPEPGPLLGRALHALGAPTGVKAGQRLSLPRYLQLVPVPDRVDFARVYALNRGSIVNPTGTSLAIVTRRDTDYFRELRDFFTDVTGETVSIHRSPLRLYLSQAAVTALAGSESDPKAALANRIVYGGEETLVTEQAVANTYRGSYRNPWTIAQQYRAVESRLEAEADPESLSATQLAREIGGDNRRIYHWLKKPDSKPYAVNGLEIAAEHGWLNIGFDSPGFSPLNKLVAWILAAGYIDRSTMHPRFVIQSPQHREVIDGIFEEIDMEYKEVTPEISFGTGIDSSDPLASPRTDGAVLGRVLSVLGAPLGNLSHGLPALPTYLGRAPADCKRLYAQILVFNRWIKTPGSSSLTITVPNEMRGLQTSISQLLTDVTDGSIDQDGTNIAISETATRDLFPSLSSAAPTVEHIAITLRSGSLD